MERRTLHLAWDCFPSTETKVCGWWRLLSRSLTHLVGGGRTVNFGMFDELGRLEGRFLIVSVVLFLGNVARNVELNGRGTKTLMK